MIETPSRGRARRTPLDGTTASSRKVAAAARSEPAATRSSPEAAVPGRVGRHPARVAEALIEPAELRILAEAMPDWRIPRAAPRHRPGGPPGLSRLARGARGVPNEGRRPAGAARPARPRFPARGPARRDGPGAPERSGAGARGSRRPARAMIPERLCVSGGEPAPRRSRERRRVFRRPDEGGRDASRDHTPARAVAPAATTIDPPAHGRVRHAIDAACVRVAGTDPGPSRSRKAAVTSSAGPDGGPRGGGPWRSGPARTGRPGRSTTRWGD